MMPLTEGPLMDQRRDCLSRRAFVVGAGVAGLGLVAGCGHPSTPPERTARVVRIGFLGPASSLTGFPEALAELGYVEGQNLIIEQRDVPLDWEAARQASSYAAGAEELVNLRVDVIVAPNIRAAGAARAATETIPIVI